MTIVFCLPGNSYSGNFLRSWSQLLTELPGHQINFGISQYYTPSINHLRSKILGADVLRGKHQKPFNGEVDYDYLMWIDSDTVFNTQHFLTLLQHDKDVVSGLYMMSGNTYYATVENMNVEDFNKNGTYSFLTRKDIEEKEEKMFKVDYTGMGWMLVRKGVFESLEYPWFYPRIQTFKNDVQEFYSEDVEFCTRVREAGFDIWLDSNTIVGHEKTVVL